MLRKPKILVVGSFMMDLIASTAKAPQPGETVIGLSFQTAPGGKGANQAVQCARLGAQVTMVGKDAFGRSLIQTTAAAGVDVSHVSVDPEAASGVGHITLERSECGVQNRITVCPGANYTITINELAWLQTEIRQYDMVMLQFELPMEVIETVAQWAHDAGVQVMVNPAPSAPISHRLLGCTTFLSPNEHEAAALAGHPIDISHGVNLDDVRIVVDTLQRRGIKNLIITLGENGSIAAGNGQIHCVPCVLAPMVADPTAAGDSFVAAFCTGLTAGLSQAEALAFASHAAALTVSRMGAMPSLPTLKEVQAFLIQRKYTGFDPAALDALK